MEHQSSYQYPKLALMPARGERTTAGVIQLIPLPRRKKGEVELVNMDACCHARPPQADGHPGKNLVLRFGFLLCEERPMPVADYVLTVPPAVQA